MSFTTSRWPDVHLAAAGRGISVCGDLLAATTLALVLQESGHGGLAVSGLLVAASLPIAVLAPLTGRLVDRADSRTLMVVVGLAQTALCAALAFTAHPALIIALVALLACGVAVVQPTIAALVPGMVSEADLPRASGIVQTASQVGMLAAPALAGILVGQAGPRVPLLLAAAAYLGLSGIGLLIRTRRGNLTGADPLPAVPFRLRDDRVLTVMTVAVAAVVAGVSAINVFEVFFIRDTLGASTTVYGFVMASWTVGMLTASLTLGRSARRWITLRTVLVLLTATCLMVLAGATVRSAGWLIPLWILGGAANGALNICTTVLIAGRVRPAAHGRAFAATTAIVQGAGLTGLLVAGPLAEGFEPRALVAGAGAAGVLAALACLPLVRSEPPAAPPTGSGPEIRDNVAA
ncbi:putative MFS transporter [Actinoplanes missouriensis 431]|uniref:Putative MFS transporter n=1 Tax=Actinoplanes missouriensis (strain ATCC 14538 / DSM 43046 / CBS 188.64 / JCM 3121 / NBRC 102363 / NCIMB 12654 / NRRL B-3342 / UNCC 431) TaxID=512565 RepID=I0GXE9_ACTM4|nr:MFS transporter [Actinoplanes missouriensis]BAL85436.1 putative MFS transporter [Actinoplanes missouriensis 431]